MIHMHKSGGGGIWPMFPTNGTAVQGYDPREDIDNLPTGAFHHTAEMGKAFYGDELWNEYTKFTIVRNTWSQKVGSYEHTRRNGSYHGVHPKYSQKNFLNWLKNFKMLKGKTETVIDYHDLNQFDWLTIDGEMSMDYIIRFENFQEDWNELAISLGIPEPHELHWGGHHENTYTYPEAYGFKTNSVGLDYSKYYIEEAKNYVRGRWKKDMDYFGFEFMKNNYNTGTYGWINK